MKKYLTGLFAFLLILNFVPLSFAYKSQQCSRMGGPSCGETQKSPCPIVNKLLMQAHTALEHSKELGLTQEQTNTLRNIKIETKKFNIHMMAEMQIMEIDVKSQMMADNFNVDGMKKMIDQMAASMPEGGKKVVDWYAQFRSTLKYKHWQIL